MSKTGEDGEEPGRTDKPRDSSRFSRRRILATAGVSLAGGLAGCGGNTSGDTDTDTPGSGDTPAATQSESETSSPSTKGTISSVEFLPDSQSFEVTFSSPDRVAEIRVKRPDGDTTRATTIDGQSATVSAKLYDSETIPGGTYTIRTLFDGEETGSASVTVQKDLRITDVRTTAGDQYPTFVVGVDNVGDLPTDLEAVELSGSIGDTTSVFGRKYPQISISVGQTSTVRIPFIPDVQGAPGNEGYAFDGERNCTGTGSVTVTVRQERATDEVVYDQVTATVSVGGDAVDEPYDKYACSQVSVESVSGSADSTQ